MNLTDSVRFCMLSVIVGSATLTGQNTPPASPKVEEAVKLEAFTVTGSNLRRLESENVLPISVVFSEQIEIRNASTPVDLLAALPQVISIPLNEVQTNGVSARGDNAAISLRGIASANTLVLLNGRRLAPHPISASEGGVPTMSVNVNQLPNRGVNRIEVLRDGASSIYGSDAVAGVINTIIRPDFRGSELTFRYSDTTDGGGREWRTSALLGSDFGGGKGRVVTTIDVFDRAPIPLLERSFSRDADQTNRAPAPWNDVNANAAFFGRNAVSEWGQFTVGSLAANGSFVATRPASVPATLAATNGLFQFVPTGTGASAFKPTTPLRTGPEREYYYNWNTTQSIQTKSRRYAWYSLAEFDVGERITLFGEVHAYGARSTSYREEDAYTSTVDALAIVPATNPWNPFGTRFWHPTGAPNADGTARLTGTPSPVRLQSKRFTEFGQKLALVDSTAARIVAGGRGRLPNNWTWEAAMLFAPAYTRDNEGGNTRESLFLQSLNETDPGTALNPFGQEFAVQGGTIVPVRKHVNSRSVIERVTSNYLREGWTDIRSVDLRAGGELLKLWGGNAVSVSIGGEYRRETYDDERAPFAGLNPPGSGLDPANNDFLTFSPGADTHASRRVIAGYAEAALPLVGRSFTLPLVRSLEVTASGRVENYSDFGDSRKPKIGATWSPLQGILVRASYNEGFRAPNLAQLFTGEIVRGLTNADPYRSLVTGLASDGPVTRIERRGGNQSLRSEAARGKSAGIVVEVPRVKGLSVSVDYWEIARSGVIALNNSLSDDNVALLTATRADLAAGKPIGQIDLTGRGDPNVIRLPVTQLDRDLFTAYNVGKAPADQRGVIGAIDYFRTSYFNRASEFVNGFDYQVTYQLPETTLGRFTAATEWTWLEDFHGYNLAGAPRDNLREEGGASKWHGNVHLSWRRQNWSAGVGAYYIGPYSTTAATTIGAVYTSLGQPRYITPVFDQGVLQYRYTIADSIVYNLTAGWESKAGTGWLHHTSFRVGIINLFNTEPPLAPNTRGYDGAVHQHIARGRSASFEVTRRF